MTETKPTGEGFVSQVPPSQFGAYDWAGIAARCKAMPGEFYKVFTQDNHSYANSLRSGNVVAFRKGTGMRVSTRKNQWVNGTRKCDLYVWYDPALDDSVTTTSKKKTRSSKP